MPMSPEAYAALCAQPHIVEQAAALHRMLADRHARSPHRGRPAGEAACNRALDAIRAGLGLPSELPGLVGALAAREAAVGPHTA